MDVHYITWNKAWMI